MINPFVLDIVFENLSHAKRLPFDFIYGRPFFCLRPFDPPGVLVNVFLSLSLCCPQLFLFDLLSQLGFFPFDNMSQLALIVSTVCPVVVFFVVILSVNHIYTSTALHKDLLQSL
jgi:hypothetical protein